MIQRKEKGSYVHGVEAPEQDRLELQHRLLGGARFLPALRSGMKLLEIGSGTGAVAREAAPKVAPGLVIGVDRERKQVERAGKLARDQGLRNVEFRVGRAEALEFPDDTFDAVYCRFLLEHVPDPAAVVREMVRVAKPGGAIVVCECGGGCCSTTRPPLPDADKALDALYRLQAMKGGDHRVAEKLERTFADAGVADARADTLTVKLGSREELKGYASGGAQMLKAAEAEILGRGLLSRAGLAKAYRDWDKLAHARDAAVWFRLRRLRGRKPGEAAGRLKAEVMILYVEDVEASRRFYERTLGFKPRLDAGTYCELDLGGMGLGLMPKTALPRFLGETGRRPWTDGAPRCELYFLADRPEAVIRAIEKAGAKCLSALAMRPWGDAAAYFEDPDGHVVGVARRTEKFYEINGLERR